MRAHAGLISTTTPCPEPCSLGLGACHPKVARMEGPAYADRAGEDYCERENLSFVTPLPL